MLVKVAVAAVVLVLGAVASRRAMVRLAHQAAHGLSDLRIKVFRQADPRLDAPRQSERRRPGLEVTSDITTVQEFTEWGGVVFIVSSAQVLVAIAAMVLYEGGGWRSLVVGASWCTPSS